MGSRGSGNTRPELEQLWGQEAVKCLPLADEARLTVLDQDLGGMDAGVVVGSEGHAVGAGVEEDGEVAGPEFGEGAVAGEEVPGLADGADDVGGLAGPVVHRRCGDHGEDLVVGLVEGGADEVVHGGVGDDEVLGTVLLGVEDTGEECAGLGDEEAAGLEEQVGVEAV